MTGGVVVVLGPTGRHFAAGMSGGIAYVLDDKGDFDQRCNLAMIDLAPIEAREEVMHRLTNGGGSREGDGLVDVMQDMTNQDAERLHRLITRHMHYTNSAKAKLILSDWADWLPKFKKVMPVEYANALKKMERAQAAQTTMPEVVVIGLGGSKS